MNTATTPLYPAAERPSWAKALRVILILLFTLGATGFGAAFYLTHKFSGGRNLRPIETIGNMAQYASVSFSPAKSFPGRSRINLLCMGLDRNWTTENMPYTKNARTDTMMVASLDLANKSVSVLSIPRDTFVKLPDSRRHIKINGAHERGGIPLTIRTVEEFLGIRLDYYVVIKQEAIEGAIDRLGGLEVKVEKQMDYDDNWGHLHVHLKPGLQVLGGNDVVGYMRFRKDAEGDFGRIRRQQQVVQTLSQRMKNPTVIFSMGQLFDVLNEHVKTNLSREQILALGAMFHHLEPQDLLTASVPGEAVNRPEISYVEPDEKKKELMVEWLIFGRDEAANELTTIEVINRTGSPTLGQQATRLLKDLGFHVLYRGSRRGDKPLQVTEAMDYGKLPRSGRRVLKVLGVAGQVKKPEDPADRYRTSADVTLTLGRDIANNENLALLYGDEEEEGTTASR